MALFTQRNVGIIIVAFSLVVMVMISLIKMDLDVRDAYLCSAVHSNPTIDPTTCPVHTSYTSWYIVLAFIFALLTAGGGGYLILLGKPRPVSERAQEELAFDPSSLPEEERHIYELIKAKEGSMYQSDLIKETGLSKVKVSRLLDRLEGKCIIDRKRRGMTNIIVLR